MFVKKTTEVIICSFQCIVSGGAWCAFCAVIWLRWCHGRLSSLRLITILYLAMNKYFVFINKHFGDDALGYKYPVSHQTFTD